MQIEKFSTYKILISERELNSLSYMLWTVKHNTVDTCASLLEKAEEFKETIDKVLLYDNTK